MRNNYPTIREQNILRAALVRAESLSDTIVSAKVRKWVVDRTELLEYIIAETDHLNDAVLELVRLQTKEE